MRAASLFLVVLTALFASACAKREVLRSAGGHVYAGRFIQARAYEAYARGSLAEAEGRLDDAAKSFRSATQYDGDGPEPWTRLGAVLCKQRDFEEAFKAFDEAIEADSTFAAAHRERARCYLARRDVEGALRSAELAAILDPEDEEALAIHVDALVAAKKGERAAKLLVARVLDGPVSLLIVERLESLAASSKDRALAWLAAEARARAGSSGAVAKPAAPTAFDIDAALARGDLAAARKLSTRAKTSQGEIALRAAAMQRPALALEQATLVLDAEPGESSAAVALLFASPAKDVESALARTDPTKLRDASRLARLLYAEVLLRYTGAESARAFLASENLKDPRKDPLEEASRTRLQAKLSLAK